MAITYAKLSKSFPGIKQVKLNGTSDFNTVAGILGTRNPKYVWPAVNCIQQRMSGATATPAQADKLKRLFED